jgi:hypothetical protein
MELLIVLGLAFIVAAVRHEIRAWRVARRRRRAQGARASAQVSAPAVVVTTLLAMLVLAGCNKAGTVKPDLPDSTLVRPTIVYVDRDRYVPIRADLVKPEPVAEGPLSQCPLVARDRKAALQRANARLAEIGAIQGSEVKP